MASSRLTLFSMLVALGSLTSVIATSCGPKDSCSIVCIAGGTCNDNRCICPIAHTGSSCQNLTLLGSWQGNENNLTTSSSYQQNISLTRSTINSTQILIGISSGMAAGHVITGSLSVDSSMIVYTKQLIPTARTPDTVSGTILLTSTTSISNSYKYSNSQDGVIYSIEGNYTK